MGKDRNSIPLPTYLTLPARCMCRGCLNRHTSCHCSVYACCRLLARKSNPTQKGETLIHSLFDRPSKRYASFSTQPSEFMKECTSLETACANLRKRIPPAFQYPRPTISAHDLGSPIYDGASDPWWIQLHIDLYTTEMLLHSQLASYRSEAYEQAISAARAVVPLVRQIRNDQWARIEMVTPICLSLVARFLNKESARLAAAGQARPAGMAAEDAETLRVTLERDIAPWLPMAGLHAMIVRRVKEGWPEKEGEYERV